MTATYVYDRASELLAGAVAALDPARTGHAVPTRQHVAWGDPPADVNCSGNGLLVVSCRVDSTANVRDRRPVRGLPAQKPAPATLQVLRYRVFLYRCWPTPTNGQAAPDAATIDTAAKGLMVDEWCLLKGVLQRRASQTLFAGVQARFVGIGDPVTLPPKGAAAGLRLDVELSANDTGP